jgi:transcriptional regulator with XRE-family HTH domain
VQPLERTDLYREVGKRIAEVRRGQTRRTSQRELAAAVGLSRASIVNIERGRHRIQLHVLYTLAQALGVEATHLLPATAPQHQTTLPEAFKKKLDPKDVAAVQRLVSPIGERRT